MDTIHAPSIQFWRLLPFHPNLLLQAWEPLKIRGKGLAIKVIEDLEAATFGSWSLDVTAQLTKKVKEIKGLNLSDEESNELMLKVVRETPQKNNKESEQDFKARVGVALQNIVNLQEGPSLVVASRYVSEVLENSFSRWITVRNSQGLCTLYLFGNLEDVSWLI